MSHHFDRPTAIADRRINLCDFYVFPAAPGTTALIVTVNPDAGRSSLTTFRPDALYEFVVASDGGTREDITFRVSFADPDQAGHQKMRVLRAESPAAQGGTGGIPLGEGRTGQVFSLNADGLAWAGRAQDPFTADPAALAAFLQGVAEGTYRPESFTASPRTYLLAAISPRSPCRSPTSRSAVPGSRHGPGSTWPGMLRSSRSAASARPCCGPCSSLPRTWNPRPSTPEHPLPTSRSTASAWPASPVPLPAWPDCRILSTRQEGGGGVPPRCRLYRRERPPDSNPAAATAGHWMMTASISPSDSLPDPRSAAAPFRVRPPPRFPTCWRLSPRTCQLWPTFSACAARRLHPLANCPEPG